MLAFGLERVRPGSRLTVTGTTFVNRRPGTATAILVAASARRAVTQRRNRMVAVTTRVGSA